GPSATFTLPIFIDNTFQRDFHISALATWNLTLERQFGKNWLVSLAYVGNGGYKLSSNQEGVMDANPAIYIPGQSTEANTQARRINPNFGQIYFWDPDYNSNYHALQVNLQRRFGHGLSILANYTWSHMRDDYPPSQNLDTDTFDRKFDYGNSLDNVPNIFHLSEVWQVPHPNLTGLAGRFVNGWEVTSILTWQNGFP